MEASLTYFRSTDLHACAGSFNLSKEANFLCQSDVGLTLETAKKGKIIAQLLWDSRLCTWLLIQEEDSPKLSINNLESNSKKSRLSSHDIIEFQGIGYFYYEKITDAPIWQGKPIETLSLSSLNEVEIGRGAGQGANNRLILDAENLLISSNHAKLVREKTDWHLVDQSRMGTELNGRLIINKEALVFGDRFIIAEYVFEFTGNELRRIDHQSSGTLVANDISVTVKDRSTGKPKKILNTVSTKIKQGEFIGILGGSGQGKSTFLDAMCGMRSTTEGDVTIGGVSNLELAKKFPGTIGYVPQDDIVHVELSVYNAFWFSGKLRLKLDNKGLRKLIDRTLETLHLTEHRAKTISTLSGGQRKRVSIGIELLSKPNVLFLDEPSSGLDPATEQSLMELLQSLSLNKLTVVCTTHVLQNAFIFNRLFFVHSGRLIFSGTTNEAREFFDRNENSKSASKSFQASPLERIYSTVLHGNKTAEDWLEKFGKESVEFSKIGSVKKSEPVKKKNPSYLRKLLTLLLRQWSIMKADWLNLAFLFAQVIVIGIITGWASSDLGFRTFIGIIAAMWFGCSNGAQQIVGELPIFRRERVCGLGLNVYIQSKLLFQGAVVPLHY